MSTIIQPDRETWDKTVPRIGIRILPFVLGAGPFYNDHERQTRGFPEDPRKPYSERKNPGKQKPSRHGHGAQKGKGR